MKTMLLGMLPSLNRNLRNPMNHAPSPRRSFLILLIIACSAHLPRAQAVAPPPDGCYPGFTTAEGCDALQLLTTGAGNTGLGWRSLFSNTTGSYNTGVGAGTLVLNTGISNTAVGAAALLLNTSGTENTAVGTDALVYNDTGTENTANGAFALFSNTEGDGNTANGSQALFSNTTGVGNTATGSFALSSNTGGGFNTALGRYALSNNISGSFNTVVGYNALSDNITGSENTALGFGAGLDITGSHNVCIGFGANGEAGVSDRTYIRNVNTLTQNFAAGVNNYVTVRLTDGRLGNTAVVSSRRYKEEIKPLDTTSQALYALKPVSFRLKREYDETQALGFGLIAEEVEKVDPALVYRNIKGQVESVRYEMVNAMLLNEFLKEHKKIEEQQTNITQLNSKMANQAAIIAQQQKEMEILTAQLKEQAAQIQKVSAQVALNRSATRTVAIGQ